VKRTDWSISFSTESRCPIQPIFPRKELPWSAAILKMAQVGMTMSTRATRTLGPMRTKSRPQATTIWIGVPAPCMKTWDISTRRLQSESAMDTMSPRPNLSWTPGWSTAPLRRTAWAMEIKTW